MGEVKQIVVISAVPLEKESAAKIETTFKAKHKGEQISFSYQIKPDVLGGILVVDGSEYYDATIKGQLERVKNMLEDNL